MTTWQPHCCVCVSTGQMRYATTTVAGYATCTPHSTLIERHGSLSAALNSVRRYGEGVAF
jgi:hypothetical protein